MSFSDFRVLCASFNYLLVENFEANGQKPQFNLLAPISGLGKSFEKNPQNLFGSLPLVLVHVHQRKKVFPFEIFDAFTKLLMQMSCESHKLNN